MKEDSRPLFYGWVLLGVIFVTVAVGYGLRYAFSVFYVAILQDFDWSRASTAAIFSLNLLFYGLAAPLAGTLVDRFGPRKVCSLGAILLALGVMACSQATELWHFYVLFGLLAAFGTCLTGFPVQAPIIAAWFVKKRAMALGIGMAGVGANYLLAFLSQYLISWVGWRSAFVIVGLLPLVTILPLALLFMRHRPQDLGLLPDGDLAPAAKTPAGPAAHRSEGLAVDKQWAATEWTVARAARTVRFWLLFFAFFFLWGVGLSLILAHQVALAVDLGYSAIVAASVFSLYGLMNAVGHTGGFLSDQLGREKMATIACLGASASLLLLFFSQGAFQVWILYVYAMGMGLCFGVLSPTINAAAADLFYGKRFGAINGLLAMGFGLGGTLGPWLGGYIYDTTGSYSSAILLVMGTTLTACLFLWLAAPRKVWQIGRKPYPVAWAQANPGSERRYHG